MQSCTNMQPHQAAMVSICEDVQRIVAERTVQDQEMLLTFVLNATGDNVLFYLCRNMSDEPYHVRMGVVNVLCGSPMRREVATLFFRTREALKAAVHARMRHVHCYVDVFLTHGISRPPVLHFTNARPHMSEPDPQLSGEERTLAEQGIRFHAQSLYRDFDFAHEEQIEELFAYIEEVLATA